ncbi:MAG: hypothetical protein ACLVI9_00780 [Anaerostipes hadrus]
MNAHVSVVVLDSIVLLAFEKQRNRCTCSVSISLEDKSIIKVHKQLGVISLRPGKQRQKSYKSLNRDQLERLQVELTVTESTDRNKTVRHAIITGNVEHKTFAKNSR